MIFFDVLLLEFLPYQNILIYEYIYILIQIRITYESLYKNVLSLNCLFVISNDTLLNNLYNRLCVTLLFMIYKINCKNCQKDIVFYKYLNLNNISS